MDRKDIPRSGLVVASTSGVAARVLLNSESQSNLKHDSIIELSCTCIAAGYNFLESVTDQNLSNLRASDLKKMTGIAKQAIVLLEALLRLHQLKASMEKSLLGLCIQSCELFIRSHQIQNDSSDAHKEIHSTFSQFVERFMSSSARNSC